MKTSAGLLLYKLIGQQLQVFLVHPGGPFWQRKDAGAWSVPKGEYVEGEDALTCARREFKEETGSDIDGEFIELKPIKQKSGKIVSAWAVKGDIDAAGIKSNTTFIEWPPKTGKQLEIPEVDRGEWFSVDTAREKINPKQIAFIDQLVELLEIRSQS
jgi:predicted NUDIX family NTP pyrophosphohydrolase